MAQPQGERSFKVAIPETELDTLRKKLDLVRFPDELSCAGWDYGSPLADVQRLVARWRDGFDWRAVEAKINKLPQYTRDIDVDGFDTLNIHYVHSKSDAKDAIPLLFVHGWPGSFFEVSKMLPLLTSRAGDHPTFHVVALSLPGFGFSEGAKKTGFDVPQYAEVGHKLMLALGYNRYVIQGGDWGYSVVRYIAFKYGPEHAKGWHTNFPFANPPALLSSPLLWAQNKWAPPSAEGLKRSAEWETKSKGYMAIQRTRPQTLGYSLSDSPAGLLAWIYEKLVAWSDNYKWDDDEVLTWVSIYWFSRAGPHASVRIYYEAIKSMDANFQPPWTSVPLGMSYFPKELFYIPKLWMRTVGNVVSESEHTSGGHFAAYEKPNELANDIRESCVTTAVITQFK